MADGDATTQPESTKEKRERKNVDRLAPTAETSSRAKDVVIGAGKGVALGEIEHFDSMLKKTSGDAEVLKFLHLILFKTAGTKTSRKKQIRKHNGFGDEEGADKLEEKITSNKKYTMPILKSMADLFGIEKGGDRAVLVKRLVEFMNKPYDTTANAPKQSKKRKSSSDGNGESKKKKAKATKGKGKKAKKGPGEKKARSGYIIFCADTREKIKKEHPDLKATEIIKKLGEMWNSLSNKEKETYNKQSTEEKKSLESKKKEKKQEEAEEEEEGEEEEDDEVEVSEEEEGGGGEEEEAAEAAEKGRDAAEGVDDAVEEE